MGSNALDPRKIGHCPTCMSECIYIYARRQIYVYRPAYTCVVIKLTKYFLVTAYRNLSFKALATYMYTK